MSGLGWSLGPLSGVGTSGCPGRTRHPGIPAPPGPVPASPVAAPRGCCATAAPDRSPKAPRLHRIPIALGRALRKHPLVCSGPGGCATHRPTAGRGDDLRRRSASTPQVPGPQWGGGRSPFSTPISPPASRDSVSHSESGRWLCGTPEERGPDAALSLSRVRFHCPSFPPSLRAAPVAQAGLNLASDLPASSWGEDRRPRLSPISPP